MLVYSLNITFVGLILTGLWGVLVIRPNMLVILMSVEIILFAASLNFIASSALHDDLFGQYFSLFILMIAASESAIGLAVLVTHYRLRGSLDINFLISLKT